MTSSLWLDFVCLTVAGAGTALLGKEGAMACTVAVEESIANHYNNQIRMLMEEDPEKYEELLQVMTVRCLRRERAGDRRWVLRRQGLRQLGKGAYLLRETQTDHTAQNCSQSRSVWPLHIHDSAARGEQG